MPILEPQCTPSQGHIMTPKCAPLIGPTRRSFPSIEAWKGWRLAGNTSAGALSHWPAVDLFISAQEGGHSLLYWYFQINAHANK